MRGFACGGFAALGLALLYNIHSVRRPDSIGADLDWDTVQWPDLAASSALNRANFERDGFVVLERAIPVEVVDALAAQQRHARSAWPLSWLLAVAERMQQQLMFIDTLWPTNDVINSFWSHSPIAKAVASLMPPNTSKTAV